MSQRVRRDEVLTVPYVYLIGWTNLNVWYGGVRYRKNCDPSDLWATYFTSSKYVKTFRLEHGEPDHVQVLKICSSEIEARRFEQEFLQEQKVLEKENWLNRAVGGEFAGRYGPHTEETKRKIADKHRGKKRGPCSPERIAKQKKTYAGNYLLDYDARFARKSAAHKGAVFSAEHRAKIAVGASLVKPSAETKAKISAHSSKCRWFTDGVQCKFCHECPEGWRAGRIINKQRKVS